MREKQIEARLKQEIERRVDLPKLPPQYCGILKADTTTYWNCGIYGIKGTR